MDELVAAAAGQQPVAVGYFVRQLMQCRVCRALGVDGHLEVGERVAPVRVAAVLADQHLGTELTQQRRNHGIEGAQPARVPGAGRQRDVHRRAVGVRAAGLARAPGTGEEGRGVLVHADREYPRVVPEGSLHAIAVMDIDVDVGDALHALLQQPGNGDGQVVVDAESAGVAAHGVMQAAGNAGAVPG